MPGPDNRFEALAAEAAAMLDRSRALGQQIALPLLGDEDEGAAGRGRGKGKRGLGLGALLRMRGHLDPADRLSEVAGLNSAVDGVTACLGKVAQVEAALGPLTQGAKLALFQSFYAAQLRALDAVMPYVHAKQASEAGAGVVVQVVNTQAPGAGAQVIEGQAMAQPVRAQFAPPPMPEGAAARVKQNQGLSE